MDYRAIIIAALLFIFSNSYAQKYTGAKTDIEQILKNIKSFSSYYTSGNYNALANSYCLEGLILPPGADIIKGRLAIKKRWILPKGVSVSYHEITPIEITVKNNWAYDIGYYEGKTIRKDGRELDFHGKYIIVWKKIKGDWKIYADIWNPVNKNSK